VQLLADEPFGLAVGESDGRDVVLEVDRGVGLKESQRQAPSQMDRLQSECEAGRHGVEFIRFAISAEENAPVQLRKMPAVLPQPLP
jgi:hypothetical protein